MATPQAKLTKWEKKLRKTADFTARLWVQFLDELLAGGFWNENAFEDVTMDCWDFILDKHPWNGRALLERVSRASGLPEASAKELLEWAVEDAEVAIDTTFLDELRNAFAAIANETGRQCPDDDVGLMLAEAPSLEDRYFDTVINAVPFASTGGDGEHYSALIVNGRVDANSPVVLTTPGGDPANMTVGANLKDFLNGGCQLGWFSLWGHIGRSSREVLEIEPTWLWPEKALVLEQLREKLNLQEWPEPADHAQFLREKFDPKIVVPYYVDIEFRPT